MLDVGLFEGFLMNEGCLDVLETSTFVSVKVPVVFILKVLLSPIAYILSTL